MTIAAEGHSSRTRWGRGWNVMNVGGNEFARCIQGVFFHLVCTDTQRNRWDLYLGLDDGARQGRGELLATDFKGIQAAAKYAAKFRVRPRCVPRLSSPGVVAPA